MKIVYIITRSDVIGGASVHLLDLAAGVKKKGHDVTILVGGYGIFNERAKELGLNCLSIKSLIRDINLSKDITAFSELRHIISLNKPDLIHLHSTKAGVIGRLVAGSLNIPTVFTAHGWAFTEGVSKKRAILYKYIERFMARFADKIIAVSEYDRRLAIKSNVGDYQLITTIHNGMPVLPIIESDKSDTPRIIMVARFDVPKNHFDLLMALSKLNNKNWTAEFVGDGPLLEEVKQNAITLGLKDKIDFPGACNDVAKRLAKADIFALISNWEGLPLTILEAMRAQLPVVASNVGGIAEAVIDKKTGFIVERGDIPTLTESLNKLLSSVELRNNMGKEGRNGFINSFSFDLMLNKTLLVYNEAINRHQK